MTSSSLHHLLNNDGFQQTRTPTLKRHTTTNNFQLHINKPITKKNTTNPSSDPFIDQMAIKAVVSILSSYVGKYLKDPTFRLIITQKFSSFFHRINNNESDTNTETENVLANLELGIRSIHDFIQCDHANRIDTLEECIKLLKVVASLNSKQSKNGITCGIPNTFLSAYAQFYMAVIYKIEKNDRICARHLLQVFCDSPFMARTYLLPSLWDQFFLPHLLHINVWYTEELRLVMSLKFRDKEKMRNSLSKVYNDQMDWGTCQFALYYKQWLKVGANEPVLPFVPLPVRRGYSLSRANSSGAVSSSSTAKISLYSTVFGTETDSHSTDFNYQNIIPLNARQTDQKTCFSQGTSIPRGVNSRTKSVSRGCRPVEVKLPLERQKVSSFQYLNCYSAEQVESLDSGLGKKKHNIASSDLAKAIGTICSSNSLDDCEIAVRVIAEAWLESHGELVVQNSLCKPSVVVGILEVLFGSDNNEILELAVSLLAELVSIKNILRQVILNSDPHLEIFIKLLKSGSMFLKASVLLHLVKPTAKQMISADWIPLCLRVLEFGDQLQTLFRVRGSPEIAALYFLEQLLTGFDEVKNLENARQLVSVGGLSLFVKMMEKEDSNEIHNVVSIIYYCLRADRSCRTYLVSNLNVPALFELLVLKNPNRKTSCAVALITELLCISRKSSAAVLLSSLLNKGGKLNLMQLLLVHLHRAPYEEQPLLAVILLQLDILQGDPSKYSVYRADVVDVIIDTLKRSRCDEGLQEKAARALLILGGRFTYTGDSCMENWLLKQAGFTSCSVDSLQEDFSTGMNMDEDEEEADIENWQRKLTVALFTSGKDRLMTSLSDAIATGAPALARACLVTVSWMTVYLPSVQEQSVKSMAVSILTPQLFKCLRHTLDVEERVLASLSIFNLANSSDCIAKLLSAEENVMSLLNSLCSTTWTARKVISIVECNSSLES